MGKPARDKGQRGERELSKALKALGFSGSRRGRQYSGSQDSPDVVGIPGLHIECKRVEALQVHAAMAQSCADAGMNVPVVCSRRNGEPWLLHLRLDDLPALMLLCRLALPQEHPCNAGGNGNG